MKKASIEEAEVIPRKYGTMKMLAGGSNLKTQRGDLRILEIDPGKETSTHYHKHSESIFFVQRGQLKMVVDGVSVELCDGDTIVIEPDEVHVLKNVGPDKAIVFEAMAPGYSGRDIFYIDGNSS